MRNLSALVAVVALLACLPAAALPQAELQASRMVLDGYQQWTGDLSGMELAFSQAMPGVGIQGEGASIRVRTTNVESSSVMGVGIAPERGGDDETFQQAKLNAGMPGAAVAVIVVPTEGAPLPTIRAQGGHLSSMPSGREAVREVAYVDSTRPLLSSNVGQVLQLDARGVSSVRVEGTFGLSLWNWNFTVDSNGQSTGYVTGSYREDVVEDPATGMDLSWTTNAQVAQVFVTDGWIEFQDGFGAAWSAFLPTVSVTGTGQLLLEGVEGSLGGGVATLDGSDLKGNGNFGLTQAFDGEATQVTLASLIGSLAVDDRGIDLGDSGPIRNDATQVAPGPSWSRNLGLPLAVVGLMAVAVLAKGPAQTVRFNRLQSRFESHDYLGVLTRIDPFTRKRRYERKATFLKTVSLLSLQEYREAALYLETMGPREAPEPATKAFLQATAAAGLGQDDVAIQHLSTCLRLDPSYKDEVKAVPILTGYLAYFEVKAPGST